jgi:hypothetical protein
MSKSRPAPRWRGAQARRRGTAKTPVQLREFAKQSSTLAPGLGLVEARPPRCSSSSVHEPFGRLAHLIGLKADGFPGTGPLSVAVTDSVATNHLSGTGFFVGSDVGKSVSRLVLTRITASGNGIGVEANGMNATLWIAQSTITENTTGYRSVLGGAAVSFGDNYIVANGSNTGVLGSGSKQ